MATSHNETPAEKATREKKERDAAARRAPAPPSNETPAQKAARERDEAAQKAARKELGR